MPRKADIPDDVFFDNAESTTSEDARRQAKREERKGPRSYTRLHAAQESELPAEEPPKIPVTLYLIEPVAYRLEEVRFLLLTEHGVKTNKSAIANYALSAALEDIEAAAEALRQG